MDLKAHFIFIDNVDKTYEIESISKNGYRYIIRFKNSDKEYFYSVEKVTWLTNPSTIDIGDTQVFIKGRKANNIESVKVFTHFLKRYYAITFGNQSTRHYNGYEIDIRRSCLAGGNETILGYLSACAGINRLGIDKDSEYRDGILSAIYSRIDFIDECTAASAYLDPKRGINKFSLPQLLFPYGCNASQQRAVKEALTNQISVIQGPPGTGKTQTILNIIANLLVAEKTVLVVSNNNTATENVLEKLDKYGLGFLVAPLGNKDNKEAFIAHQPPLNPALPSWQKSETEMAQAISDTKTSLEEIETVFELQERLAVCRHELADVEVEKTHFEAEHKIESGQKDVNITSAKLLKLLRQLKESAIKSKSPHKGLWHRLLMSISALWQQIRLRHMLKDEVILNADNIEDKLLLIERLFYNRRLIELSEEISSIEYQLSQLDAEALMKSLTDSSMIVLKSRLAHRFSTPRAKIATVQDLFNNGDAVLADYPIVLSTTFSSRSCFSSDTIFDYVIMDEASQVGVETGFLALTCARNAVIVGDKMQLPNVVTDEDATKLRELRKNSEVPEHYDASRHSFLTSVVAAIPTLPQTLLREHYRCHPDIINFCNQKFYGGNLLIMTEREDDRQHLFAMLTSPGFHCRGHYNQREIDAVKIELLPILENKDDIGIISPYNGQVEQFKEQIPNVEVATVHKYQGREKDTIVFSVTDDVITDFSDNANLLNVAVSRAKDTFCLVVSGNTQELKGNIHDLLGYIRYRQGVVIQSKLHSIFDYLFTRIEGDRKSGQSVSEFESENKTFDLVEKIRTTYPQLSHIKVLCHYPLCRLIRDLSGLTEREVRYVTHPATHIDFLVINRVSKEPLLAIETDGYSYHNEATDQYKRDIMKDCILARFGLPLVRLSTIGHSEEQKIVDALLHAESLKQ